MVFKQNNSPIPSSYMIHELASNINFYDLSF